MNRLDQTFRQLRERGDLGLFPYLTTGFPDPTSCAELLELIAAGGADGIELGVPFSDPLADGATLQRVGALALEQGASIKLALDLLRAFRRRWQIPVVLMSYYNPILAYGAERLASEGLEAGLDGLIVPDVPLEEIAPLASVCDSNGLQLAAFLAPTSTDERISATASLTRGFIYCVALLGVTGARSELSEDLPGFLSRVRQRCTQPLVVGFGISSPSQVAAVHGLADGVIVASALANLIEVTPPVDRALAVTTYVQMMKAATRSGWAARAS